MNELAVSTIAFRESLGPIGIDFPAANGGTSRFEMNFPRLMSIADVPRRIRDRYGVSLIETVGFQFTGPHDPAIKDFLSQLQTHKIDLLNVSIDAGDLVAPRSNDGIELVSSYIAAFAPARPRFVRTRAHWPTSDVDPNERPPAGLIGALRRLSRRAARQGSKLLVENLGGASSEPSWIEALIGEVGAGNLGLVLDLGNFDPLLRMREDGATPPTAGEVESIYEAIERLIPLAEIVHMKVLTVDDHGVAGPIDIPRVMRLLKNAQYRGPLTLEYEEVGADPWLRVEDVLGMIRSQLQ